MAVGRDFSPIIKSKKREKATSGPDFSSNQVDTGREIRPIAIDRAAFRVIIKGIKTMAKTISNSRGIRIARIPKVVAVPFPPVNFKKIDQL